MYTLLSSTLFHHILKRLLYKTRKKLDTPQRRQQDTIQYRCGQEDVLSFGLRLALYTLLLRFLATRLYGKYDETVSALFFFGGGGNCF